MKEFGFNRLHDLKASLVRTLDLLNEARALIDVGEAQYEDCIAHLETENKRLSDRQEHDFSNNVKLMDQVNALKARVALADEVADDLEWASACLFQINDNERVERTRKQALSRLAAYRATEVAND